ncbi:S9 family peptidase [Salisediminibacterium selenitireducens]|uniref:Peptidase S9 prolyl oligopeptidase active site domain protein n=1 Tax=Bacillus selenitireducens (strain ATCC 700615 / DSM 15326 / MLS10) TaxID=439292 RepID=D6XWV4_BACIE|nr:S9 family peptidase [Salisediminibacterium selenitireducens]ADH99930.1 peptidase S9 prolyl oligopeptidase active site domain protein [[Bacillus] selenitireducens MLS10]
MKQEASTVQESDIRQVRIIADPILHPDSQDLYFIETTITGDNQYLTHLYLHQKHAEPLALTSGPRGIRQPRLSPDGQAILYIRKPESSDQPQVFIQQLLGGEGVQVTQLPKGVQAAEWASDKDHLFITAKLNDTEKGEMMDAFPGDSRKDDSKKNESSKQPYIVTRLDYKSDAAGFKDETCSMVAKLTLSTGQMQILTPFGADHQFQDYHQESNCILITANRGEDWEVRSDLYEVSLDESLSETDHSGSGLTVQRAAYYDGNILLLAHEKTYLGATHNDLWMMRRSGKEKQNLTAAFDWPVGDQIIADSRYGDSSSRFVIDHNESKLYTLVSLEGTTQLYAFDLRGKDEPQVMTSGRHHVYNFDIIPGKEAVVAISTPVCPGEIHSLSLSGNGETASITNRNENWVNQKTLFTMEEVRTRSSDQTEIQGWIMGAGASEDLSKKPAILEIHGGPHAMYGYSFFHELQYLVSQGYIVMLCNPRGSHGYSQAFVNAVRGDYGGMDYEDLMAFTDACLERYPEIDQERLGVTGGSYGGFMTNWIIGSTDRFKAAATLRSICNWTSFFGVSDIGYFFTEWEVGETLLSNPERLWQHSPLRLVADMNTPLLIMHGEKDYRCPIEQAEQLFTALRFRGQDVRFVRMPDANHELSRSGPPELREARLKELSDWFNSKL